MQVVTTRIGRFDTVWMLHGPCLPGPRVLNGTLDLGGGDTLLAPTGEGWTL